MFKEVDLLIVGGDDSNHAGTAKGEIIVSTFSMDPQDSIVRRFKNGRDYEETQRWLNEPTSDFIYTTLLAERYRHSSQNLVETIPKMTEIYLLENKMIPKTLKMYLDGRLERGARQIIRDEIRKLGVEKVVVDNFTKKNKNEEGNMEKRPCCPKVVYHADVLANYLNSRSYFELTSSERFRILR